jgi:hypothetical protein
MRPDPQYVPPRAAQLTIGVAVACPVPLDLRAPPVRICFRPSDMLRAPMPVATVNEEDDAEGRKNNVNLPP